MHYIHGLDNSVLQKISFLHKLAYKFKTIRIKILAGIFVENGKLILKLT